MNLPGLCLLLLFVCQCAATTPSPTTASTPAPTEATPSPTSATPAPTEASTPAPTEATTPAPTEATTPAPTEASTPAPTEAATPAPTEAATPAPTDAATPAPTDATPTPTDAVTPAPTEAATPAPTDAATPAPTDATPAPTDAASPAPTEAVTPAPTDAATPAPTDTPAPVDGSTTTAPTPAPVDGGTTGAPTAAPTPAPTDAGGDTPAPAAANNSTDTSNSTSPATTGAPTPSPTPSPTSTPVPTVVAVTWDSAPTSGGSPVRITLDLLPTLSALNLTTADVGAVSVAIGEVACANPAINANDTVVVVCDVGAGVGTGLRVAVGVNASDGTVVGTASKLEAYSYDAPSVSALSPLMTSVDGGVTVTVTGLNFGGPADGATVTIGDRPCTDVSVIDHSTINCATPIGVGNSSLVVSVGGQASPPSVYSYAGVCQRDVSCSSRGECGTRGDCECAGGFQGAMCEIALGFVDSDPITVTVAPFGDVNTDAIARQLLGPAAVEGVDVVIANSTVAGSVYSLTVVVRRNASVEYNITQLYEELEQQLANPSSLLSSSGFLSLGIGSRPLLKFVTSDHPRVLEVTPRDGPAVGGYPLTVTGLNFGDDSSSAATLVIGGNVCDVLWVSSTKLVCSNFGGGVGARLPVSASRNNVTSSQPLFFSINAPVVLNIEPPFAKVAAAAPPVVDILGLNFGPFDSGVNITFDGFPCLNTTWKSDSHVQCQPQTVSAANLRLVVAVGGQEGVMDDAFTYITAETVNHVLPPPPPSSSSTTRVAVLLTAFFCSVVLLA